MKASLSAAVLAVACAAAGCAGSGAPAIGHRDVFYVGGVYVGEGDKQVMRGAMYVEHLVPRTPSRRYPLLLISGTAQTAVNWMTTPDGRDGWAQYFAAQGYEVYLVDQPARGRSAWVAGVDGETRNLSAATAERLFTASTGDWPHAELHTQWPGTGLRGDPAFDQFFASQVSYLASTTETQAAMQHAGAALLDRIGPAVLLTHSQSGPFGWLIADARPSLVKGIVAIEPQGPPMRSGDRKTEAWGVTDIALTYAPPIRSAGELNTEQQSAADAEDLQRCWLQREPARQLPHLKGIPTVILTTEASYHAAFDHCTVKWLRQAGLNVDAKRLADLGIHGNGHMVMLEKNNLVVSGVIDEWIKAAVR